MAVERNAIAPSFLNLVDTFLAGINNLFNGKLSIIIRLQLLYLYLKQKQVRSEERRVGKEC